MSQLYTVVLERSLRNAPCGTTSDVIEALSIDEAVETAISMWKAAAPRFTYRELFVKQITDND